MNTRPHPYQGCALPLSYGGDPDRKDEAKSRAAARPSRRRNIGKDGCGRKSSFARRDPLQSQQNKGLPASSASLSEAARGRGVARALVEAVYEAAKSAGVPRVYWQTHETNATAMRLYDRVAERSGFLVYRHAIG